MTPKPTNTTTPRRSFTISVFPHVKKFMQRAYRTTATIKVEEYTTLGKLVTVALLDKRIWKEYNDNYYRDRLTEKITLHITSEQAKMSPKISKLMRLNVDVDREFKEHLVTYIQAQQALGTPPFESCRNFLADYNLDDKEYSLDSAYKHYQRSVKK